MLGAKIFCIYLKKFMTHCCATLKRNFKPIEGWHASRKAGGRRREGRREVEGGREGGMEGG